MADPLPKLKRICLGLPEAKMSVNHGHPCFTVREKTFVMFMRNHHGDGRVAIWCKAPPGDQADMVESDPVRFFVPPYVGPRGWIGVRLDRKPNWKTVDSIVRESWRMTAPKRLLLVLATCALLFLTGMARADAIPPPGDCNGKKAGDACLDDQKKPGACGTLTYTATNYATNPPTSSQRTYFGCRAGDKPTSKLCSVSAVGAPATDATGAFAALALSVALVSRRRLASAERVGHRVELRGR